MNTNINTLFIGKVLLNFDELESTNTYALSLLSKNKPSEGTVVYARNQSAGRGQIGNSWESETGKNITISIVLYPSFLAVDRQFVLNMAVSLGVMDFLVPEIGKGVKVKWPNDIYIDDRKVAGILIQNTLSRARIQSSIVGIGININQRAFRGDASNPTSLSLECSKEYDLKTLLPLLFEAVERRYLQLRALNFGLIERDYLHHLYRFQEDALYRRTDTGVVFSGKIVGLTGSGKLRLDTPKGQADFSLKQIKFL